MVGIDLFAGAGGMTLGAKSAGVNVKFAVEINPAAAQTYRINHSKVELLECDIAALLPEQLPTRGGNLVLFGGPPCQGFSTSNQRNRGSDNPRNWLFREFFRVAQLCSPEWIVFENVTGIAQTAEGYFLQSAEGELARLGYQVTRWTLNAADFGVPQQRERIFVIGSPPGAVLDKLVPTSRRHIPVSDALEDLPDLTNGANLDVLPYGRGEASDYARVLRGRQTISTGHWVSRNADFVLARYPHVPPGGNWENIPAEMMTNYKDRDRCHTGIYHRLDPSKPSKVIGNFRKNMLIHPRQDRGLSIREAARIQSFPDSYEFQGSIGQRQQQVGNAVPPRLAEQVFRAVLRSASVLRERVPVVC